MLNYSLDLVEQFNLKSGKGLFLFTYFRLKSKHVCIHAFFYLYQKSEKYGVLIRKRLQYFLCCTKFYF